MYNMAPRTKIYNKISCTVHPERDTCIAGLDFTKIPDDIVFSVKMSRLYKMWNSFRIVIEFDHKLFTVLYLHFTKMAWGNI